MSLGLDNTNIDQKHMVHAEEMNRITALNLSAFSSVCLMSNILTGSFHGSQYFPQPGQQYPGFTIPASALQSTPLSSQRALPSSPGTSQLSKSVGVVTPAPRSSSVPPQQPAGIDKTATHSSGQKQSPKSAVPPRSPAASVNRSPSFKTGPKTTPSSPLLANIATFNPNVRFQVC
jgi:hypothetical protein